MICTKLEWDWIRTGWERSHSVILRCHDVSHPHPAVCTPWARLLADHRRRTAAAEEEAAAVGIVVPVAAVCEDRARPNRPIASRQPRPVRIHPVTTHPTIRICFSGRPLAWRGTWPGVIALLLHCPHRRPLPVRRPTNRVKRVLHLQRRWRPPGRGSF